jgi:hypothetical protein
MEGIQATRPHRRSKKRPRPNRSASLPNRFTIEAISCVSPAVSPVRGGRRYAYRQRRLPAERAARSPAGGRRTRPCPRTSRASRADQGRKARPRPGRPRRHTATATAPGSVAPRRHRPGGTVPGRSIEQLPRLCHGGIMQRAPAPAREGVAAGFDRKEPVAAGSPSPHYGHGYGSRGICSVIVVRGAPCGPAGRDENAGKGAGRPTQWPPAEDSCRPWPHLGQASPADGRTPRSTKVPVALA